MIQIQTRLTPELLHQSVTLDPPNTHTQFITTRPPLTNPSLCSSWIIISSVKCFLLGGGQTGSSQRGLCVWGVAAVACIKGQFICLSCLNSTNWIKKRRKEEVSECSLINLTSLLPFLAHLSPFNRVFCSYSCWCTAEMLKTDSNTEHSNENSQ